MPLMLIILLQAISLPALSTPCSEQNYLAKKEPDFLCPGPGELGPLPGLHDTLVAPRGAVLSIGAKKTVLAHDALVIDSQRLLQLGLRVKHLRQLRYADTQRCREEAEVRSSYDRKICRVEVDGCLLDMERGRQLYASEVKKRVAAEDRISQLTRWYRSPVLWAITGVVVGATGIAWALH